MPELKSKGKCLYCGQLYSKQAINRHLQKHLTDKITGGKAGKSFLVRVETDPKWGRDPYFLSLCVDSKAVMGDIDYFLRANMAGMLRAPEHLYQSQK